MKNAVQMLVGKWNEKKKKEEQSIHSNDRASAFAQLRHKNVESSILS